MMDAKIEDPAVAEAKTLRDDRIEVAKLERQIGELNSHLSELRNRGLIVELDVQRLGYYTPAGQALEVQVLAYRAMRVVEAI